MSDRRIVIADDDPNLLEYFHNIFERDSSLDFFDGEESSDSFQVTTFSDGAPLVDFFKAEHAEGRRIPICLLDMRMPTMDGLTAAEAVRSIDPEVFIVILTAYADVSAAEIRSRLKEDIYYVKKPFYEDELYSLVTSLFTSWTTRQALRESERHYRELVQALNEGIVGIDSEAAVNFVNERACEMLGYTEDVLLGRPLRSLIAAPFLDMLEDTLRLRREGRRFQYETALVRKDGRAVSVLASIAPKFSKSGVYQGSLAVVTDLTTRIQMERDLLKAKEGAEAANRAKSQFLANMSHEIRTPMNGVLGMTQLLLASELDPDQRHMAESVMTSGRALLTIINDILDFSKIEAGKLELESIDFNLEALLDDVKSLFAHEAAEKGLDLIFTRENGGPRLLRGDPGRLRQILLNVVGNAVKFTERGSVQVITALRRASSDHCEVIFEVRDTGVGIPFEAQSQMFDSFSQADESTTRKYGGTGLGLAISRQLCDLMHGRIYFTSIPGEGTTFHFTAMLEETASGSAKVLIPTTFAPSSDSLVGAVQPTATAPATMAGTAPPMQARVLVAEDAPVNREILKYFLENLGIQVDLVQDGREAVDAVSKVAYDLVIMDCQMPEMDGYEATRIIRERERKGTSPSSSSSPRSIDSDTSSDERPGVPIIALTAHVLEGDRGKCLEAGMNDYVPKPIGLQDITAVLERWLPSSLFPRPVQSTSG